jgi:hypothetical protein
MGPKKGKAPAVVEDEATIAARRKEQQAKARIHLREQMEIESKNSRINQLKIQNQWRKIMRLTKTESLKKDIEVLSQNHERDVDRKDAILQMLDRDLEEAEDQYQMANKAHTINVDALIQLHDNRLYALERNFQQDVKRIQEDFSSEREVLDRKFSNEKKELQIITDAIDAEEADRELDAKHTYDQIIEDIRNRNLEDINVLRISLDAQIEELENHFEIAHLNYLQQTAQRTHDFKELTQTDQRLSKEIEHKRKSINALQSSMQLWKAKTRRLARETEERNRLLQEEKRTIQKHYQQLKQRIVAYRSTQNQRLLQLSQNAAECKGKLQEKLSIARRVLHLSELTRKYETEQERVMPFADMDSEEAKTSAPAAGGAATDLPAHIAAVFDSDGSYVKPSDRMTRFHKKYNRSQLQLLAIEREEARLEEENNQLEDLLQQYLSGLKVDESTLRDDNPLFVVNGRAGLNHVLPVRNERPLVQEGTIMVSSHSRQYAPVNR